ncbi:MAG: hypothetical protein HN794_05430, partial [Euryarchaeota archaeon]|nr:hypothetical protein [Euryarchaeota archaeon]
LCYDHNNGDDGDGDGDDSSPEEVMQMFDTNEDGSLSWSEFWDSWMADGGAAEDEESLSAIFNDSDSDMDGLLSIEELEYFIAEVSTFDNENMEDEFICDDGSTIPMSYVNDGSEDCDGGEDESDMSGNEDYEMWTFLREMSECDSNTDGMVDFEELDACVSMDLTNDGYDSDSFEGLQEMFDMVDANEDGMLDSDEFATFATMTNGEPMMVCYNMDTHEIDMSINSEADCEAAGLMWTEEDSGQDDSDNNGEEEFVCDDGSTIPMSYVNDGEEDCDGGEDEYATDDSDDGNNGHGNDDDGHDESNPGNSHDEIVMYITTGEDFYFEGDMSDYKIELASCEEDYSDTGELTRTCETVMSIAINDAGMDSNIMFHDADSSGTISVGDMVHIGETSEEWDTVRLYSVSADAYSDEYPVHNAPGFTGLVGMLALLGAAFIRRSE